MSNEVKFDDQVACDMCGHFGAYRFEGEWLCGDCYGKRGSCCAEFAGNDLSSRDEPRPRTCEAAPRPETKAKA